MKSHLNNTVWLMFDKFFVLFGGLIAYILVSKHLGPEELGKLTFAVAISSFGVTLSQWGANHTIYNISVLNKGKALKYIESTNLIRCVIYIIFWIVSSLFLFFSDNYENDALIISLVILVHVFLSLDIYQFYYNGTVDSKINATSNLISRTISTVLRLVFVLFSLKSIWFVIPYLVNNFLLYFFRRRKMPPINKVYIRKNYRYKFFKDGKYFLLGGMLTILYTKINEIILADVAGFQFSGQFSVATTLGFAFTFVPVAIGTSYLSKALIIKNESDQVHAFSIVNTLMVVSYVPLIILAYFFGDKLVSLLLGDEYLDISKYIWLMTITGLFSSLSVINNRIIGNYTNGSKYLFYKILWCSLMSVPISYFFVTRYGMEGAVYSLFIIEFFNLSFSNYLFKSKVMFKIHFGSFFVTPKKMYHFIRS
ncbi:oligosaccharide flippase family protein [Vibrio parahaemolyticus]|nr:oligosaccharide flippase family protein [Vibrio parahaemolyticus]MDF4402671.1 oligosaccharide flippase family protein [Vibrio parahaemolyticus]